ncbi:MAG TPA: fibronectin/fibrinogen-binding protein, partial [Ruminiclostridium sp.]|nr:fibronectin/fibrinogen-binding protein [Ruminiclostridium sp.]
FFVLKNNREFSSQRANDLLKLVEKQLEKCEKRLAVNLQTYESSKGFGDLRLYGELLTANIYTLSKGMDRALVSNYYSESGETAEIPLSIDKTPQQNAQAYFKKYNKARTAFKYSEKEIEVLKAEITYLESVIFAIENAGSPEELAQIRLELYEQGYLKAADKRGHKGGKSRRPQ